MYGLQGLGDKATVCWGTASLLGRGLEGQGWHAARRVGVSWGRGEEGLDVTYSDQEGAGRVGRARGRGPRRDREGVAGPQGARRGRSGTG